MAIIRTLNCISIRSNSSRLGNNFRKMVKSITFFLGRKGIDISLRLIVFVLIFTAILIVLAYTLKLFYPNPSILDQAKAIAIDIF
jgi:hypothetical protein